MPKPVENLLDIFNAVETVPIFASGEISICCEKPQERSLHFKA